FTGHIPDLSTMLFSNLAHEREAKAGAARMLAKPWQAIEGLKNAGAPGLRDAGPAIANHDNGLGRVARHRDLDGAFAAMAPCVFEQVAEEPVQEPDIALDENGLAWNHGEVRVKGSAFLGKQPDKVDPLQRKGLPRIGIEAAGQQNFIHQPVEFGDV